MTARPRAPIALVHGSIKVFLNDPSLLDGTLQTLRRDDHKHTFGVGILAEASRLLLDSTSKSELHSVRSLHDGILHFRRKLDPEDTKLLQQVHKDYCLMRHLSDCDLLTCVSEISSAIDRGDAAAKASTSNSDKDIRADCSKVESNDDGLDVEQGSAVPEAAVTAATVSAGTTATNRSIRMR